MCYLLVTFAGPIAAGAFLAQSKKAARAARRSPLTSELLRPPGYSLRERLEDIRLDVAFDLAILMVIPTVCYRSTGSVLRRDQGLHEATRQVGPSGRQGRVRRPSSPVPDWQTAKPVEQAERQTQWFSEWLSSALGCPISAIPVLALPGWYVELKRRGAVRVFSRLDGKNSPPSVATRSIAHHGTLGHPRTARRR